MLGMLSSHNCNEIEISLWWPTGSLWDLFSCWPLFRPLRTSCCWGYDSKDIKLVPTSHHFQFAWTSSTWNCLPLHVSLSSCIFLIKLVLFLINFTQIVLIAPFHLALTSPGLFFFFFHLAAPISTMFNCVFIWPFSIIEIWDLAWFMLGMCDLFNMQKLM